jgi:formate hydrogenlyase subunit 4
MRALSFIMIIITSWFFTGIIIRTKSIFSGRKGPGIFQPMKDIIRSLRIGSVYSKTSSIIFQLAPTVYFATILMAIKRDCFPLTVISFSLPMHWPWANFS